MVFNFFSFLLFFPFFNAFSQDSLKYPKNYFRSPLDIPLYLAGNFAEIRPNHFHGGIDIKTESVEGKYIYSIAKGHVSRIKISTKGYGKALYIDHPNGYTSVYAHLQKFSEKIEEYVKKHQYKKESFEIELNPSKNDLLMDSAEIVAFSGNTGGSSGPHLHFEIRDTKTEWGVNPLLFGFDIKDEIPPIIKVLGIYPLSDSSSVNGKNKPVLLPVFKSNGNYHIASKSPLNLKGAIGFGVEVIDNMNNTGNVCGIFSIELSVDSNTIYYHDVERVSYDETRYINCHVDYEMCKIRGRNIQRSFLLPGNKLGIYKNVKNRGVVVFKDSLLHRINFIVKDSYGNTSTLDFTIRSHPFKDILKEEPLTEDSLPVEPDSLSCEEDTAFVNLQKDSTIPPQDTFGISIDSVPSRFNLFKYNEYNSFETDNIIVSIPKNILYDNLLFEYSVGTRIKGAVAPIHRIHHTTVPLHSYMTVSIKSDSLKKQYFDKSLLVSLNANGIPVPESGSNYADGYVTAKTRSFGSYTVMLDTIPPGIKILSLGTRDKIMARISDNLSGIKLYSGTLDGKWILMEYDYKTGLLVYNRDFSRMEKGKHLFQLTVTDERGNSSIYKANISFQ